MAEVSFTVWGDPAPGGSKIHGRTKDGRIFLRDTSKRAGPWKRDAALSAREAMIGRATLEGPLKLGIVFYRPRPKSHLRANGQLRATAPERPLSKPDLTKLIRPLEDAMRGIVFKDDAQIVETHAFKFYDDTPRAEVVVRETS